MIELRRSFAAAFVVTLTLAACATDGPRRGAQDYPGRPQPAEQSAAAYPAAKQRPKLVVQIVVDQLRGDEPLRYRDRFVDGGFRYLLEQGTWYTSAFHPHSHTETIVGHTTLATGAYPSRHGMVSNTWYDRETNQAQNNISDPDTTIVGSTSTGSSPRTILTTTIGDELSVNTNGGSKIFAVSAKDRGAVSLAGHTGKAFWYYSNDSDPTDPNNGSFVSSTYYYDSYPAWVTAWNAQRRADSYAGQSWDLLLDRSTYLYQDVDNVYPEGTPPEGAMEFLDSSSFKRTFPHAFGAANSQSYYTILTITPFTDVLTLEFAKELIAQEGLGDDDVTDYLGISFSSTDIIGHWFSPASLESEDNVLRLDRTLAELFAYLDARVGLENTLITLAGDHGVVEFPEYLEPLGIPTGRLTNDEIVDTVNTALADAYGANNELLLSNQPPYIYLDYDRIEAEDLDRAEVEHVVVSALMQLDGVDLAVAASDLAQGGEEFDDELIAQIRRNQHPTRSGDIYVVQDPQWQNEDESSGGPPVTLLQHGSPWTYDTYVPIAFAGASVPAAWVSRPVYTVDVAATLTSWLVIRPPSGAVGSPLQEVLSGR